MVNSFDWMEIVFDESNETVVRGNFQARVVNGKLVLPVSLRDGVIAVNKASGGGQTCYVEIFVSYVNSFPTTVAHYLDWDPEEVVAAGLLLLPMLEGYVEHSWLYPEPPSPRAYGALPPKGKEWMIGKTVEEIEERQLLTELPEEDFFQ